MSEMSLKYICIYQEQKIYPLVLCKMLDLDLHNLWDLLNKAPTCFVVSCQQKYKQVEHNT